METVRENKKILQVIDALHIGGAEQVCVMLTNLLAQQKQQVSLLLLNDRGALFHQLNPTIPIIELHKTSNLNIGSMFKCANILKKYDIVHVHMRYNYKYIRLIQFLFRLKIKVILHDHYGSIDEDTTVPVGFSTILKPAYYVGVSNSLTTWALNKLQLPKKNVFLLANVVSKLTPSKGLNNPKGFVMVGNIKLIKNQLFAIRLMEQIDNTLTIYGNVQDVHYYEELKATIEALDIGHKILFVHGETNIQEKLPQYELGLHTAISESGPLVLIEFLAQSVPFVCYTTGEVPKLLEKELPEFMIDNFEIASWKQRIEEVQRTNYSNLEYLYQKNFSEQKYVENCLTFYQKITDELE